MNTPTTATTATLHLAKILVSYEHAIRLLGIRDTYDWHQLLWQAFPERDGQPRDFLVRIDKKEDAFQILLLSCGPSTRPNWCPSDCYESKPIPDSFFEHSRFAFSLLANPTRKVRSNRNGEVTKNGRRLAITSHDELLAWLQRKAKAAGFNFDPEQVHILPRGTEYFHKRGGHGAHASFEFRGHLSVVTPAPFRQAVVSGIGSGKAFGFGLLVLAPIH